MPSLLEKPFQLPALDCMKMGSSCGANPGFKIHGFLGLGRSEHICIAERTGAKSRIQLACLAEEGLACEVPVMRCP